MSPCIRGGGGERREMSLKLAIEEIANGYIITGPDEKVYREKPVDAVTQARVYLDDIAAQIKAPKDKD